MMVERMFPEMKIAQRAPRLVAWRERMTARPAVRAALDMPDHTAPGLRTFTGHVQ
jgi:glutathione S-transferase